jgi:hypothetical protein
MQKRYQVEVAMTKASTVVVTYVGEDEVDAWLEAISDSVTTRRMGLRRSVREPREASSAA